MLVLTVLQLSVFPNSDARVFNDASVHIISSNVSVFSVSSNASVFSDSSDASVFSVLQLDMLVDVIVINASVFSVLQLDILVDM